MTKTTLVRTDDPGNKVFNLVVTGLVEKIADISPESVYLTGNPGDTLASVVTITPAEKYKFSILGMEQNKDSKIQAELVKPSQDKSSWQIKINSTSDKANDFYDVLVLKTDSQYSPTLTIRVYATFIQKQEKKT